MIFKTSLAWDGQVYAPGDPIPVSLRDHNHAEYKRLTELGYIGPAEQKTPGLKRVVGTSETPKKGKQNDG